MSAPAVMQVSLRLPTRVLHEGPAAKLTARAEDGAFGILPAHIDFVAALVPSVLVLTDPDGDEHVFGIDEGLLVKQGRLVRICVRRAARGRDLESLKQTVRESFVNIDEEERRARAALARLEADMVRRFAELKEARG